MSHSHAVKVIFPWLLGSPTGCSPFAMVLSFPCDSLLQKRTRMFTCQCQPAYSFSLYGTRMGGWRGGWVGGWVRPPPTNQSSNVFAAVLSDVATGAWLRCTLFEISVKRPVRCFLNQVPPHRYVKVLALSWSQIRLRPALSLPNLGLMIVETPATWVTLGRHLWCAPPPPNRVLKNMRTKSQI